MKDLKGEKKELFEEQLAELVNWHIDVAEEYLEEQIRPRIAENYQFYRRELPKARDGEARFTDNTCAASVDHITAQCVDAFTPSDTLEIIPMGVTNPTTNRVINAVVNDVLDSENQRFSIYQSFFRDAFIAGASVMKPYVKEDTIIERKYFNRVSPEEVAMRQISLEMSQEWDSVELTVEETVVESITVEQAVPPTSRLAQLAPQIEGIGQTVEQTFQTGFFTLTKKEKTIKIEQIPAENFLINREANSIECSNFVGHKAMVEVGSLLDMGFDYDKVKEVAERCGGDDDAESNIASRTRRRGVIGESMTETSLDHSMKEVELFEAYIRTGLMETVGKDDESYIATPKLFQVFMAGTVLLDYQEVDFIPYVGTSPTPVPHMFWGFGPVDQTKDIQRALTGLMRQQFAYNELATKPRFQYIPENIVNPRDLLNPQAGAGIAVKAANSVMPIQLMALSGDTGSLMQALQVQRENGTGISYTGQSMMGDVLKAGGSTVSAQMVLSEQQKMVKATIQTLLEGAIKPLIEKIYNLLRENMDEWEISVDGQTFKVSPNAEWPRLREVRVKTPLGKGAKLEKAQTLLSLYTTLASGQGEAAKFADPVMMRQLLVDAYEYQDIPDASSYIASEEQIAQKDQMAQQMQQMQQMVQQMQKQLADATQAMSTLTQQNQALQAQTTAMAQQELDLRAQEVATSQYKAETERMSKEADASYKADQQALNETKAEADMANMADEQALKERQQDLKEQMAREEAEAGVNLYTSV